MYRLKLQQREAIDDKGENFTYYGGEEVVLEHSLYTVSIFERLTKREFITKKPMTVKDITFYIVNCMCMTPDVPKTSWLALTNEQVEDVMKFITDPYCATTVSQSNQRKNSRRKMTAEVIYATMFSFGVPLECEHWHFNRLNTLLAVLADMNTPSKKMSKKDAYAQQKEQNERMKKLYNSKG